MTGWREMMGADSNTAAGLRVFALEPARKLGERVARALATELSALEERSFEDGEHKTRPLASVRGCDVFVLQTLHGEPGQSVNDKLCRLLFLIGALKDAAAAKVTAVVPYLCYARKDRKTKARDPVTTRYVARLFEAVEADRVVTLDVHNLVAYQNAFRCATEHLEARLLFVRALTPLIGDHDAVVVSPDAGGVKRAERFREALAYCLERSVSLAFMEKHRSAGVVSGDALVGAVGNRTAILVDDLISTGGTLARAAKACKSAGATKVFAVATHGVFARESSEKLAEPALDRIFVSDSIRSSLIDPELLASKFVIVETAPLIAESIRRMSENRSLVELLELPPFVPVDADPVQSS